MWSVKCEGSSCHQTYPNISLRLCPGSLLWQKCHFPSCFFGPPGRHRLVIVKTSRKSDGPNPAHWRRGQAALQSSSGSAELNSYTISTPAGSRRPAPEVGPASSQLGAFSHTVPANGLSSPAVSPAPPGGSPKWKVPVYPHLDRFFSFRIYYPEEETIHCYFA